MCFYFERRARSIRSPAVKSPTPAEIELGSISGATRSSPTEYPAPGRRASFRAVPLCNSLWVKRFELVWWSLPRRARFDRLLAADFRRHVRGLVIGSITGLPGGVARHSLLPRGAEARRSR
jgi:hypothetical protein